MQILFAWLGNTDLRASEGDSIVETGPILNALQARDFGRIEILSDQGKAKNQKYLDWLASHFGGVISAHAVKLSSPTCFEEIYREADKLVGSVKKAAPEARLVFHLSPGTPAMAAVWILLAKAKYGAELIESSREQGVKTVAVPFDLAAEFMPTATKSADEALARLAQGLPPESPEFSSIIHRCSAMKRVVAMAHRLALRDVPVLIQGESGTGKELFARAIHGVSHRRNAPFVTVNCGAIPSELVDAELFGHEKGAFTGAAAARAGYFESADGGTLFLDEIGELPLQSQVRLLRVLQEQEVTRLGATRAKKINVRIVAATNRVLSAEVQQGRFREDLFHRLAVGVLLLPALREREGDISLLVDALLEKINLEAEGQPGFNNKKISVSARKLIIGHPWPGNIRELHNTLLRASIWAPEGQISEQDMAEALAVNIPPKSDVVLGRQLDDGFLLPDLMGDVARHYLERAMAQAHGNKTEAARLLGLGSYQTLTNWLEKYGVGD